MDLETLCNLLWLQLTGLRDFCGHIFIICEHILILTSTLINVLQRTNNDTELLTLMSQKTINSISLYPDII